MRRFAAAAVIGGLSLAASAGSSAAQGRWWDDAFTERRGGAYYGRGAWQREPDPRYEYPFWQERSFGAPRALSNEVRDGGPRPAITPVAPAIVPFAYDYPAKSIVIDSEAKQLYYVLPGGQAYAYQISVGREGFDWTGTEVVSRKQDWPDWHPPAEMRQRDSTLPAKMTGGLRNPLGAMALYLGTTLYRIHGTNDERSLGQAGSSGCFRMLNANVMHLASITEIGTTVHVVASLAPPRRVSEARPLRSDPSPRVRPQPPPRPEYWQGGREYRSWRDDPYWRWR